MVYAAVFFQERTTGRQRGLIHRRGRGEDHALDPGPARGLGEVQRGRRGAPEVAGDVVVGASEGGEVHEDVRPLRNHVRRQGLAEVDRAEEDREGGRRRRPAEGQPAPAVSDARAQRASDVSRSSRDDNLW